jgi:hypothetical protein
MAITKNISRERLFLGRDLNPGSHIFSASMLNIALSTVRIGTS